jgi:hypothetical protein
MRGRDLVILVLDQVQISISRSRRRGRSPSKSSISCAAVGSIWRPFGVALARLAALAGVIEFANLLDVREALKASRFLALI